MWLSSFGCYVGLQGQDGQAEGGSEGAESGESGADDPDARCGEAPDVGPTRLRRLTNAQFNRTVSDLLGLQGDHAAAFTPDERVGAFKSNAIAPVAEVQVEHYLDVAEALASLAAADLETLLPCDPAEDEDACIDAWLDDFVTRAYRRPPSEAELSDLRLVYDTTRVEGSVEDAVRVTVAAALQSPFFLYHVEFGEADEAAAGAPVPLTGYELASRLSYFLWDTMPDDALFDAAASDELRTDEGLAAQVERMLADPRAKAGIETFHLQWLGIDEVRGVEKNPDYYPDFSPELAVAMERETADFANYVLGPGDGRLSTLLTGSFTVSSDPELLALYGVQAPADHEPGTPIELPAAERAGVLTQAAWLSRHAHADQSSPVHRGKLVRENLLCQPLPPPPPDVDNVPPDPDPNATTRERFAEHTGNPACAGCHSLIDGLGFGFEQYDGMGAFRTHEGELAVDASGDIVGTTDIDGPFVGAVELATRLAASEQVSECVSRQWFRFALGRLETEADACATDRIYAAFVDADLDIRVLLAEIATSEAFRHRKAFEATEEED